MALLLAWFAMIPSNYLPLRIAQIVGWVGFLLLNRIYEGFPSALTVFKADLLLVVLAGVQWALIASVLAVLKFEIGLGSKFNVAPRSR